MVEQLSDLGTQLDMTHDEILETRGSKAGGSTVYGTNPKMRATSIQYDIKGNSFKSSLFPASTVANSLKKNKKKF